MHKDRILTLILERMDESLVVMAHYLNWSLADVVIVKSRKALSGHPQARHWPSEGIQALQSKLDEKGETAVYKVGNERLDVLRR